MDLLLYSIGFFTIALASKQIGKYFSGINLPYITGYLFAGVLVGPFVLDFIPREAIGDLRWIDELSLAVIAFVAGSELYLKEMRSRLKPIALNAMGVLVVAFILGATVVYIMTDLISFTEDFNTTERVAVALLASTVLLALSPASTIAVIKEVRAQGPFTRTVLGVTVVMDVVIIVLFAIIAAVSASLLDDIGMNLSFVAYLAIDLGAAVLAGYLISRLMVFVLRVDIHAYIKAGLILAIGTGIFAASFWIIDYTHDHWPFEVHVEPLLVAMVAGFMVTNFSDYRDEFENILHDVGPWVYVAFFTLTGISLKLDVLLSTISIAAVLFVVRIFSIGVGSYIGGTIAGESEKFRRLAWMGLITQAGIALGLGREVAVEFPQLGDSFATMVISVVVLNEIFGPMFLKSALKRAGETHLPEDSAPENTRTVLILGIEGASVALARQLQSEKWNVKLADTVQDHVENLNAGLVGHYVSCIDESCMEALFNDEPINAVVAMLENDEENKRAIEIAYEKYGVKRLTVRPRTLDNTEHFIAMGATVVEPTTAIVNLLDQSIRAPESIGMFLHQDSDYDIIQLTITNPEMDGKIIKDLRLPQDALILRISRNGQSIIPDGFYHLHLNDEVTLVGNPDSLEDANRILGYS